MIKDLLYIGIDYHPSGVQLCAIDQGGRVLLNKPAPNDAGEIRRLIDRLPGEPRIAIGACTGAADPAEHLADRFGWSVSLAHAGYVSRLRQQPGVSFGIDGVVR